jgi:hypothetical protein
MSWNPFQKLAQAARGGGRAKFALPKVVLEIQPYFVAGARLEGRGHVLKRLEVQEFEAPALQPAVQRPNLTDAEGLRAALRRVEEALGGSNGSFGLLLPDGAVRVGLLSFETLPDDPRQAQALVEWRMRDNLPCAPEEARLAYQELRHDEKGVELLVTAAKTSVLGEYEDLRESSNGGARLLLPATLALLPLLSASDAAGELLVHVCAGWMTSVVLEGGQLRAWRTGPLEGDAPEALAAEVAAEAGRVLASARDRQNVQIERVWLCERPRALPDFEQVLGRAVAAEVLRLEPAPALAAALSEPQRALFERYGTAVAGLLSNP